MSLVVNVHTPLSPHLHMARLGGALCTPAGPGRLGTKVHKRGIRGIFRSTDRASFEGSELSHLRLSGHGGSRRQYRDVGRTGTQVEHGNDSVYFSEAGRGSPHRVVSAQCQVRKLLRRKEGCEQVLGLVHGQPYKYTLRSAEGRSGVLGTDPAGMREEGTRADQPRVDSRAVLALGRCKLEHLEVIPVPEGNLGEGIEW